MSTSDSKSTTKDISSAIPSYDYNEHIIDSILPAREIHLFAGPSGAGKTTILMKLMESIAKGHSIFNHSSVPTPFVYISGDRSDDDCKRTMDRLGVDKLTFPLFVPSGPCATAQGVIDQALKKFPHARLIVFEGFATFVPDGKLIDYKVVSQFLKELQKYAFARNLTIWGVVHTAKSKKEERYLSPRERIMGSAAWGAYSNTIFYLEPVEAENIADNPMRQMMILPRNAKEEAFKMDWKDGLLVPVAPGFRPGTRMNYDIFCEWFDTLPIDRRFNISEAREATHLAPSSLRFEIKKMVDAGFIINLYEKDPKTYAQGFYEKIRLRVDESTRKPLDEPPKKKVN